MTTVTKGKEGEDLACKYLKTKGYQIIERNFRIRGGEIDIIAKDGNTLVYVEVKTRGSESFGRGEEAVTPYKIRFLIRAAKFFRNNRRYLTLPELERIDVVSINTLGLNPKINHIENITL